MTKASTSTPATTANRGHVGALRSGVSACGATARVAEGRHPASVIRAAQTVGRNSSPRSVPKTMISTTITQMMADHEHRDLERP